LYQAKKIVGKRSIVVILHAKTGFAAQSGHERTFGVRKPPEKAMSFLEKSMQNLFKTVRKRMFPTGIICIFLFFLNKCDLFK